jgi:RNA polymerase sigma factor (sigma-70 family)
MPLNDGQRAAIMGAIGDVYGCNHRIALWAARRSRVTLEDVRQEMALAVCRAAAKADPRRDFAPYAVEVGRRRCRELVRHAHRPRRWPGEGVETGRRLAPFDHRRAGRASLEDSEAAGRALAALGDVDRAAVVRHCLGGETQTEMAKEGRCTRQAISLRICKALATCRAALCG